MKRLALSILFLYILIPAGIDRVFAAEYHTFSLGPEVSYIKYSEPGVMEEKGIMYGIDGNYTYYRDNFVFRPELRLSYGQVDYKNSGTLNDIDDYIVEGRAICGYEIPASTDIVLTPYVGLGYRYLNDDASGRITSDGSLAYKRESNYLYSPIGIELMRPIDDKWSFGATLEYDLFWRGWQKSYLSGAIAGYNDLENTQKKGYGLRGSLKFSRSYDEFDIIIEPFLRYWNIKKSDNKEVTYSGVVIGYGYEPKNDSTEVGLMVSCRWGPGRDRLRIRDFKRPIAPTTFMTSAAVEPGVPMTKTPVSVDDYYESVRRDIALAVSEIRTTEKGHARLNVIISSDGRVLYASIQDEGTTLSEPVRAEIINAIYAAGRFQSFPPALSKSQISFVVPVIFQ